MISQLDPVPSRHTAPDTHRPYTDTYSRIEVLACNRERLLSSLKRFSLLQATAVDAAAVHSPHSMFSPALVRTLSVFARHCFTCTVRLDRLLP